ncbi:MAG: DUF4105 domain-containing protein [Bdellovibrionales bacterium]|jgi:hypothetical protein|nr:DUF4105 domain-containing protein [Bdellovibrionales bacterium]
MYKLYHLIIFLFLFSMVSILPSAYSDSSSLIMGLKDKVIRNNSEVTTLLLEVESLLPPKMVHALTNKIIIKFTPLLGSELLLTPCGSEEIDQNRYGRTSLQLLSSKVLIELNYGFLSFIKKGQQLQSKYFKCRHGSARSFFMATIIHELMHAYDILNIPYGKRQAELKELCNSSLAMINHLSDSEQSECEDYRKIRHSLSTQPRYDIISRSHDNSHQNLGSNRSPDKYEYTSPQESLAVNFEYFILDKEFKCRRPLYYNFFADALEYVPYKDHQCSSKLKLWTTNGHQEINVDLKHLYRIDYLLASRADNGAGRWGHAMLRMVFCQQPTDEINQQCEKNLLSDIVISFRAAINDPLINSFKGIFGGYTSEMFIYLMPEIIKEYNTNEFRDIVSYPLDLNQEEMKQFALGIIERYWEYRGEYFLFQNNCASETMLQVLTTKRVPSPYKLVIVTPYSVLNHLQNIKLVDSPADIYPSSEDKYQYAFEMISKDVLYDSMKAYIDKSTPDERREIFLALSKKEIKRALLTLELLIIEKKESALKKEFAQWLSDKQDGKFLSKYQDLKSYVQQLSPSGISLLGYGIPQKETELLLTAKQDSIILSIGEMFKEFEDYFIQNSIDASELKKQIELTQKNVLMFIALL